MIVISKIDVRENSIQKKVTSIANRHCEALEEFWGFKMKYKPLVFLLKSRKEIDFLREQKTDRRLVGWFWRDRSLFILSPEKFKTESGFLRKDFSVILKHELVHFFFLQATGGSLPAWLDEGLACHLAQQTPKGDISISNIHELMGCHYNFNRALFPVSTMLVKKLITKRGKNTFINFLKNFKGNINEEQFRGLFRRSFNFDFSEKNIRKLLRV